MRRAAGERLNAKLLDLAAGLDADERAVLREIVLLAELAMLSAENELSFRRRHLRRQQQNAGESRALTAISNVMKTKHAAATAAISNLR